MKNLTLLLLITTGFFATSSNAQTQIKDNAKGIVSVRGPEFKKLINDKVGVLIDVRTSGEYAAGNIKGSSLITIDGNFTKNIEKLDKNTPVLVYCRSGNRSYKAAQILKSKGFITIYNLSGGFRTWQY